MNKSYNASLLLVYYVQEYTCIGPHTAHAYIHISRYIADTILFIYLETCIMLFTVRIANWLYWL